MHTKRKGVYKEGNTCKQTNQANKSLARIVTQFFNKVNANDADSFIDIRDF